MSTKSSFTPACIVIFVLLALSFFCVAPASAITYQAPNYYVDGNIGNDSNDGSLTTPWKTMQHAANAGLQPGDVICVVDGDYYPDEVKLVDGTNGAELIPVTTNVRVFALNRLIFPAGTNLAGIDLANNPGEYFLYVYRSWRSNNGFYKITHVGGNYVDVEGSAFALSENGESGNVNKLSASVGRPIIFRDCDGDTGDSQMPVIQRFSYGINFNPINEGYADASSHFMNDYYVVDGFSIKEPVFINGNHNVLRNSVISYATAESAGVAVRSMVSSTYNIIEWNTFTHNGSEDIYIGSGGTENSALGGGYFNGQSRYTHVLHNTFQTTNGSITENAVDVKEYNPTSVYAAGVTPTLPGPRINKGTVIEGNNILNHVGQNSNGMIQTGYGVTDTLIYNNSISGLTADTGHTAAGILIHLSYDNANSTEDVYVFNNLLYNSPSSSVRGMTLTTRTGGYAGYGSDIRITHNTLYNIGNGIRLTGESLPAETGNVYIANNIFSNMQPTGSIIDDGFGNKSFFTFTHNLYTGNPSAYPLEQGRLAGTDPQFLDVSSNNFTLRSGSPAIDSAASAAEVTLDIQLITRPQEGNLDRGAYEYIYPVDPVPREFLYRPVYRFWSDMLQTHFYTASEEEKNIVITEYDNYVWRYEGIAYYAYLTQASQTVPVYRFWSDMLQTHFYTASEEEKNIVITQYDDYVWRYEGVSFYVYPFSYTNEAKTVYRFWSDMLQGHFYTASTQERDIVINDYYDYIWRYEGAAWNVPN